MHLFASGATLPSATIHIGMPDVPSYACIGVGAAHGARKRRARLERISHDAGCERKLVRT
jgi:hypothetical protein